ncbi:MAG: cytochrome c-type biogenesis protein CcmH [Alphaproteobacteria bacterium]|nr:MAG: cytochrome c-type biogenesis protein CcmH [Alphaproteobacteria bacterium]
MKDKKNFKLLILFCLIFSISLTYPKISKGNEQTTEKRLNEISNNVRCLVCRNQSIYDSNSDFANDIKKIIIIHLKDNKSDEFIYKFLKSKYGEYILFKPPFQINTLILWILPFILIISGLIFFTFKFLKFRKND